jgi:hypothetical protein
MRFTFVVDAKRILLRAYSMWATYLAALFMAISLSGPQITDLLPCIQPLISERMFAWVSFLVVGLIPFLRTVSQVKLNIEKERGSINEPSPSKD